MTAYPTLELTQDPPARPRFDWRGLLTGGVLGLLILVFIRKAGVGLPPAFLLLLFPAIWISLAVHEAGHALASVFAKVPIGGLLIGGFSRIRSGDRWILRFNAGQWMSGGVVPLPEGTYVHPSRYAWIIAAGPIASIALAALSWWACGRLDGVSAPFVRVLAISSTVMAMNSLVPMTSGLLRSDAAWLLAYARGDHFAESWMALMNLQAQNLRGQRPRDWDAGSMRAALASEPDSDEYAWRQLLAHYHALDLDNRDAALSHLETALRHAPREKSLRQSCFLEAATACATLLDDPVKAREWLRRAVALRKPEMTDGVEAAIATAEGRYVDALTHLNRVSSWLDRSKLDSGLARFGRDRIAAAERKCQEALAAGPIPT
jgi:hypothetical protein